MSQPRSFNRILIAKPGLDGHDRGAKFIARLLRDNGFEVIYTGIRKTPKEIAQVAVEEDVKVVGLSSLSGAHLKLFPQVVTELKALNASDIVVVGGGVIPEDDIAPLMKEGVARIFTPGTSAAEIVECIKTLCEK